MKIEYRHKVGNKSYSRRKGTYSAVWLNQQGEATFWGSYNPDDGSYYLAVPGSVLASGMWLEGWDGDYMFQHQGCYNYAEVRRALQLGILYIK